MSKRSLTSKLGLVAQAQLRRWLPLDALGRLLGWIFALPLRHLRAFREARRMVSKHGADALVLCQRDIDSDSLSPRAFRYIRLVLFYAKTLRGAGH